jgi:hypothetical protein
MLAVPAVSAQNASGPTNASPAPAPASPYDHSPIRYHLDASNLTLATRWYDVKIYQAFSWWTEHGQLEMGWTPQFQRVDDASASTADVRMWFRDSTRVGDTCDNNTEALGCAHYQGTTVDIEIKTRRDGDGAHYSYDVIGDVAKHEIGHALGLPHSARRDDIMFPSFDTTAYADARPVDDIRPALLGIGVVLLLIVGSVWAIGRVSREREDEDTGESPRDGTR